LWQLIAIKINNDIYIPRIENVIKSLIEILKSNDFFKITLSSLYRTIVCYICALCLAMVLGILTYIYPFFNRLLIPINSFLKTIPTMVLVVLALVWFNKDKAPYIVGFAIVFPILYEGIINNLSSIDKNLIQMLNIYEVSLKDKIRNIYLPVMKFYFMSIFVSTFSLAFKVVIAGEVHGQPKYGIGAAIQLEKVNFNTQAIFAWIVLIAIMSFILELLNKIFKIIAYKWER
jgi:NitT/TauT family transport system permease protein